MERKKKAIRLGSSFTLGEAAAMCKLFEACAMKTAGVEVLRCASDKLVLRVARRMYAMRDRGQHIASGGVVPRKRPLKRLEPSYAASEPAVVPDAP